jgi:hypothetical protein
LTLTDGAVEDGRQASSQSQMACAQVSSGSVHVPQLALQQISPTAQVFLPHAMLIG